MCYLGFDLRNLIRNPHAQYGSAKVSVCSKLTLTVLCFHACMARHFMGVDLSDMSTKAAYLEHYLDSLETLPTELQRNFTLMRDLDTRTKDEVQNVDKICKEFLEKIESLTDEEMAEETNKIRKMFKKAQDYGDDKVQLAMQTYEMVDKHIRRLDADLARFEADLKDKALNPHSSETDTVHKKKGRKSTEKEKKRRRAASDDDEIPKSVRKKIKQQPFIQPEIAALPAALTINHPSDVLDMPVDPNEPTYCFCHQVSYGEMIGCDNPDSTYIFQDNTSKSAGVVLPRLSRVLPNKDVISTHNNIGSFQGRVGYKSSDFIVFGIEDGREAKLQVGVPLLFQPPHITTQYGAIRDSKQTEHVVWTPHFIMIETKT
ncbi:Inhibitor of growth protein 4 [Araneus ventricosus]|uniref:Inhibitor of growth protein 4 n=1 Tax=Araneus ventricosus TaxID=182803 RepID=A0A4Y2FMS6_ARAVE|nr:Inhibitor of growth protein 4 [Araneus ventricosus]